MLAVTDIFHSLSDSSPCAVTIAIMQSRNRVAVVDEEKAIIAALHAVMLGDVFEWRLYVCMSYITDTALTYITACYFDKRRD